MSYTYVLFFSMLTLSPPKKIILPLVSILVAKDWEGKLLKILGSYSGSINSHFLLFSDNLVRSKHNLLFLTESIMYK